MRKKGALAGLGLALLSFVALENPAHAHIKWLVETGEHPGEQYPMDLITFLILLGVILFVASAVAIDQAKWSPRFGVIAERAYVLFPEGNEWRIIATLSGILLIINSITGVFLASDLVLPNQGLAILGKAVQMVVGLMLVTQISFSLAGLLILVVALPVAIISLPITLVVDYVFEFGALGLGLIFVGVSSCALDQLGCQIMKTDPRPLARLPLPIMRIGVGLSLAVAAIHNKLIDPNLALTVLDEHHLNFMPDIGLTGFTNLHFAFAAGVNELVIGLLLVFGIATRFVTAVLSAVFLASWVVLGSSELVGHLPLFGIALLLMLRGSGAYRLAPLDFGSVLRLARAPGK